jgi:cystathionine beta-lyase
MSYDFTKTIDRRGTYCTQWDFTQDRFGRAGVLPFSISDTDFEAPAEVVERLVAVVQKGQFGYSRWNHSDFKLPIAGWFERRYGVGVRPAWIAYSPSVMYSASVYVRLVTPKGGRVLALSPMYDSFPGCIEGNGRELVASRLIETPAGPHSYEIDWEDLAAKAPSCQALLLCNPHNPCGRLWTSSELTQLMELAARHGLHVISDEIHADIVRPGLAFHSALEYLDVWPHISVVSSSSKTFNTAALGGSYIIEPESSLYEAFLQRTRHADYLNSPAICGMYATMEAYTSCDYYADGLAALTASNMDRLAGFLNERWPQVTMRPAEATYLAWMNVTGLGVSDDALQEALVNVGVGIMRGDTYGEGGEGHLRMCIGCPPSKLELGLAAMDRAFASLA